MAVQTVFKRYELKYILIQEQKKNILKAMEPYMELDKYGRTTIRNIYYDTEDYLLARRSIEKPIYKEKLRVRSYSQAKEDSLVFVELKKKYDSVVYKRRLQLAEYETRMWLDLREQCSLKNQIANEIEYFLNFYGSLKPMAFLSYEREAYYTREKSDFRVTFDENILYRNSDISLTSPIGGALILPEGKTLMEIKCSGAIPLWMINVLSENKIFKTTYSKYGTAYKTMVFPNINNDFREEFSYA